VRAVNIYTFRCASIGCPMMTTIVTAEDVDESLPWYCHECAPMFDRLALLEVLTR
jgi:hypothetical protein